MSGEYYGTDDHKSFYKDYETASLHSNKEKYGQDHRLNDIEEQLEVAENRCNTLKDQLDHMKDFYGVKKVVGSAKSRKISVSTNKKISDENLSQSSSVGSADHIKIIQKKPNPQPGIVNDNSGAAVRTINNILNGITNSVNRLSELHQISDTPRSRIASAKLSPNRYYNEPMLNAPLSGHQILLSDRKMQIMPLIDQANLHVSVSNTKSIAGKIKTNKRRTKEPKALKKQGSAQAIKKNIKVDKKIRIIKTAEDTVSSTRRVLPFGNVSSQHAKLVEIFHNKEARGSDSDEEQSKKKNHRINCDGDHYIDKGEANPDVPLLQLANCDEMNDLRVQSKRLAQKVTEDCFEPPEAPRVLMHYFPKNYQLPTIASRMKQVAKSYLNSFSFKTMVNTIIGGTDVLNGGPMIRTKKAIPFCPAISTSPSHNIGINIQQVMNILKNRQPINGISPTLAHNIGLAAERLNSRPLSTLVSTINSKTCYVRPQQCPLSKCKLNYQQLQDLAKSIPEETQEEVEGEDSPEMKTIIITGPSGDMEVKSKNIPSWAVDSTKSTECTCVPQTGTDLNYIANKFKRPGPGKLITSQISISQRQPANLSKWNPNPKIGAKRPHTTINKPKDVSKQMPVVNGIEKLNLTKTVSDYPLNAKDKNLKEVLTHLHDEFEQLNTRYEELSKNAASSDEEAAKEMGQLEEELNKKEEEITMVMTLCKEVMALKHQIKTLKKISSQCSVSQEPKETPTSGTFNDYNNPQAAFHLTKLLKQIQTYQMRYKNGVGV